MLSPIDRDIANPGPLLPPPDYHTRAGPILFPCTSLAASTIPPDE